MAAASVAGALFSTAAVAAALETPVTAIEIQCEEVVQQQLFLQRAGIEAWPDGTTAARYGFRHALYQELWHEHGTVNQRQLWHKRIGLCKERAYNGRAPEIAAELAMHFEQGRDYRRAVRYCEHAGKNASQRSAHVEAITHLTKGLELLQTLPDTLDRTQQELSLQVALRVPLLVTKGFAASEVRKVYARAQELCRQVGDTPQLLPVLWGLCGFYTARAELGTASEMAEQCLRLAQRQLDPALLVEAHLELGNILFFRGEFAPAREHLEQGSALYDCQKHGPGRSHPFRTAQDPGVICLSYGAWTLWFLGYPDQALKRIDEALALAHELSQPFDLAYALGCAAMFHQSRGEWQAAQEQAERLLALCREQGFTYRLAMGTILRGWALARQGEGEEGILQISQGLAAWRATGAELIRPYYLALLTEAYGRVEQTEEGLTALSEALTLVNKTEERWHEAELYRLKGTLTLQKFQVPSFEFQVEQRPKSEVQGLRSSKTNSQILNPKSQEEAEACFLKAIAIARHQQAKSLELQATVNLSRLWQQQGKTAEARKRLADIYGWFTEGFDTADLQEAKALLGELT